MECVDEPLRRGDSGRELDERGHIRLGEPAEAHLLRHEAAQLGKARGDGLVLGGLVFAIRPHEDDIHLRKLAREEVEHEQGRFVRCVEVLEHEQDRLLLRRATHELGDRVEEPEARAVRIEGTRSGQIGVEVGELGQELREVGGPFAEQHPERFRILRPHERSERLHPRPVRRRAARLPAAAPQHVRPSLLRPAGEFVGEAALADPRLADEQEEPPTAGQRVVEPGLERVELPLAADERPRGAPAGHGRGHLLFDLWSRRRKVQRRVLAQDAPLELLELWARLDSELLDKGPPRDLVRVQGLCLAPGPIERKHELGTRAFA
jgi:hypothetical protein